MSTLSTYKTKLTEKLAQTSTAFHDATVRISAINEAIQNICEGYDIYDLVQKSTLTFASGKAAIPATFFRMVKLWLTSDINREFTYLPEDLFDVQSSNAASDFWTIDYDTVSQTRAFYIVPTTETAFTMRFVRKPTTLALDNDESGISANFDDVVAYWAASILLTNERTINVAQEMERKARALCVSAIQSKAKQGGVKQGMRLRSRFEKYSLLNNKTIGGN